MYDEVFKLHADILKALANSKRLEIINLLRNRELTVTELQEMLGLRQANLSQHLQMLRKYEVVTDRREGKQIYYRLAHRNFIKASDAIRSVLIEKYHDQPISKQLEHTIDEMLPIIVDPVCGMRMSAQEAAASCDYKGRKYFFCATGCRNRFKRQPAKFAEEIKVRQ